MLCPHGVSDNEVCYACTEEPLRKRVAELEAAVCTQNIAETTARRALAQATAQTIAQYASERDEARAEVERLKLEISAHDVGANVIDTRGVEQARELTEARARIERLEGALGEIVDLEHENPTSTTIAMVRIARQALDKESP